MDKILKKKVFILVSLIAAISLLLLAGCTNAALSDSNSEGEENTTKVETDAKLEEGREEAEDVEEAVRNLVTGFGERLKLVSLLAPEEQVVKDMEEHYKDFISSSLMEKWKEDPSKALGRLTSSPWPERIDIISIEKISDKEYRVEGEIVEVTSTEAETDDAASKTEITLTVIKDNDRWVINDI
ncbi:MAG: hypothetical protein GXY88_06420 [Tissierellia bacterium]|nr:hypothetical protein [Tissierellia bacterium]